MTEAGGPVTEVLDQQFVVHLYLPTEGPGAGAAYRALTGIWQGCRLLFHMTEPVPGTGLPHVLPSDLGALPADGEIAVVAQERPGADCQAVLRRHHDLLNLSVALAPAEAAGDGHWWRELDRQWQAITAEHVPALLGEARLFLARVDAEDHVRTAAPSLYQRLGALLPDGAHDPNAADRGVPTGDGLALWETAAEPDERLVRKFVLAIAPDADPVASAWVWSRGDTAIPPLARYLLHGAKLRYQLRVWQRDGQARRLKSALDTLGDELRRLGAAEPVLAELLRLRRLDARFLLTDLRELRRSVEIAADNLGRSLGPLGQGPPMARGAFADDAALARTFLERLDDESAYLTIAADRAEIVDGLHPVERAPSGKSLETGPGPEAVPGVPELRPAPRTEPDPERSPAGSRPSTLPGADLVHDRERNVFVVYGRDEPARVAVFELLRALGLRPLEWEDLVAMTGKSSPFLGEVIAHSMPLAQAVVVLMTPEDEVRLHPDLWERHDDGAETGPVMQARPNVLLELGMALAVHPDRTLILLAGDQRPVTDVGGRNYVRITRGSGFREKIVNRLRLAGCPVAVSDPGWRSAGDFSSLEALRRAPEPRRDELP
ncbi:putative nucleotide-binding protein [Actinomadura pelletieri DSM 43383]|uniref:Putative nucleotide-binding protein n=1 Tax=Actinomadura pelletieri DSM 43383 TaxID=1120940 RepID=A0A495QMY1_9ACTN|nr:CATRA conflict system CASPASE/TPR repeat-associated protein [Actinomadura pelletieri]RKS74317.1 putative nucleotide-binding protein [Actinomadura pelletieri DSM 43383]